MTMFPAARGLSLVLVVAASAGALHAAQIGSYDDVVCHPEFRRAVPDVTLLNESPLRLERAMHLFRFNRRAEAVAVVDAALKLAAGAWRHRIPPEQRVEVQADLEAFRRCLATSRVPAMATLTVRTWRFVGDDAAREAPAGGAAILVEGVLVGRTGEDGIATVQVPSGQIHVTAEIPLTYWGEDYATLAPGGSGTVAIGLHDGKEVVEDTDLVLAEAEDDIISATVPSFTLKFMRDGVAVPIAEIDSIELSDRDGNGQPIDGLFAVVDGAIAATDTASVLHSMAGRLEDTIVLTVRATDPAGLAHADDVRFRIGQSGLVVTLSAPPSNPALGVSDVEVTVSVMGSGIAVRRVSDAGGRFQIDSFPHGTVAFEAAVTHGGLYYYAAATMAHFGPRSVTLVLRHVSDIVNRVPALELGPPSAERPPAPRRVGGPPRER